jgi:hypothetical protein
VGRRRLAWGLEAARHPRQRRKRRRGLAPLMGRWCPLPLLPPGLRSQAPNSRSRADKRRSGAAAGLLRVEGDCVLAPHRTDLLHRAATGEAQAEADALRGAEKAQLLRQ